MPAASGPKSVVGLDLASSPEYGARRYNRVGLAALTPALSLLRLRAGPLDDEAIVAFIAEAGAGLVAIDAPLSLPAGRCCARDDCPCARLGRVRAVDRACLALGLRPYPALIPSMRPLTLRGIALRARLEGLGLQVIEVFPGAAQEMLGLPRKQGGLPRLLAGLRRLGLSGLDDLRPDGDLLDALTAAYIGHLYRQGRYWALSAPGETAIVFPLPPTVPRRP